MMFMWIILVLLVFALFGQSEKERSAGSWTAIALVLLLVPVAGWLFMMSRFGMGSFMGMYGHGGWGWAGWVVGLLLVAGLIALGYYSLRRSGKDESEEMRTLRLRLARGEITPEEFDLLRQTLEK